MKALFSLLILICMTFSSCHAQNKSELSSLKLIETIALPGVSGRIDHFAYDSKRQIIFVSALGNNSVEVVDLKNQKVIHSIKNLSEPQGIVFIPENNSLVVANGGNGECDVFNAVTFEKTNSISLGDDADNARYDSTAKKIYVGYGSGGIAIIDAANFKIITQIKFSGHPESFQIDKSANRIFVNVPENKQIIVIDLAQNKVAQRWKTEKASSNFPMALDATNHRLLIGCRRPSKMLVLDSQTGKPISSYDTDSDADDIFYNVAGKEIYLSCGGGYVDVFGQADANTYVPKGKVQTKPGARTSLFIPGLNQLIVASPSGFNSVAQLFIYIKQ